MDLGAIEMDLSPIRDFTTTAGSSRECTNIVSNIRILSSWICARQAARCASTGFSVAKFILVWIEQTLSHSAQETGPCSRRPKRPGGNE